MSDIERLLARPADLADAIPGEVVRIEDAAPDQPLTAYAVLAPGEEQPLGPRLCGNCVIGCGAKGNEVQVRFGSMGIDNISGSVELRGEDSSGNSTRTIRAQYDDECGLGTEEADHAKATLEHGIEACDGPTGRRPFRRCGALASFMYVQRG